MPNELEIHDSVEPLESEWSALADGVASSPFDRPGWYRAWWEAFGAGSLRIHALRRDGGLVGVLPLAARRGTLASPTNWHSPGFAPIAAEPEVAHRLVEAALERRPRRLRLAFLEPSSSALAAMRERRPGYRPSERVIAPAPYLDCASGWERYWAGRSRNLRQQVSRKSRRAGERGELSFEVADGTKHLERALSEGLRVEALAWKGAAGTAINSAPDTLRFYEAMSHWAAEAGLLRLGFLRIGGRTAAFELCLETTRRHYLLKTGFDPAFSELSPGLLLTHAMVRRAFELGLRSYEFLGASDSYKLRWAEGRRDLVEAQLFATTPLGMVERLLQTRARSVARRLLRRG